MPLSFPSSHHLRSSLPAVANCELALSYVVYAMRDLDLLTKFDRLWSAVRYPRPKRPPPYLLQRNEVRAYPPPSLPPEIWILILRYATSSYPLQDYSSQAVSFLSFTHSHSHLQRRLAYYRAGMQRKALLTLVCKEWHSLAQEILFEFIWISRASAARTLAAILLQDGPNGGNGKHIRHLHIETSPLERCCPIDLRTILDCSPRLVVYSDHRSVRRNFVEESRNPRSSPQQLLSALAHPNNSLKRLSWTNYDDVSFHIHMSPMLETTAAKLEFLELNFSSTHLHSMFPSRPPSPFCVSPDINAITLTLPALRSLKVTLDNATFAVLSTWSMPALENLSVLSADFSYTSPSFAQFFLVHGPKLIQLELGHSSSTIEEHYLTAPPSFNYANTTTPGIPTTGAGAAATTPAHVSLAACCPNLVQFICSADADWNWQNPNWIEPHVLLPSHPTLQFIGIRDIDKRLRDDMHLGVGDEGDMGEYHEQPFFRLLEQIGSLARREAFPSLRYIRDMSWESDIMRRGGGGLGVSGVGPLGGAGAGSGSSWSRRSMNPIGKLMGKKGRSGQGSLGIALKRETKKVLRFWTSVLDCCRDGGVWMEDYRGVNVTMRDLRRAEAGVPGLLDHVGFEGFGYEW